MICLDDNVCWNEFQMSHFIEFHHLKVNILWRVMHQNEMIKMSNCSNSWIIPTINYGSILLNHDHEEPLYK